MSNNDDETIDEFERNVGATQNVVRAAQKERGAKDGEVVIKTTLLHYWAKENRSQANPTGTNTESPVPPPIEKRPKRDESGDYIAKVPMQCELREMNLIKDMVEVRTDGLPGWRVKFEVSAFEKAEKFIQDNAPRAWATMDTDPTSERIRQFTSPDGKLLKYVWMNYAPGASIRCTAPDKEGSLFRTPHPAMAGALKVQPLSELEFNNVVPSVYLSVNDGSSQRNAKRAAILAAASAPDAGIPIKQEVPVAGETRLYDNYTFVCKSNVLHRENMDLVDLCASERHWLLRSRDQHALVPIEMERTTKTIRDKCYFYVATKYMSKWAPDQPELLPNGQGVVILRDRAVFEKDFKNASQDGTTTFYGMVINFTVFQWVERPNTRERYIVQARSLRKDTGENLWRSMGITNPDAYAAIMQTHPEIPLHIMATFWRKASLERPANQADQINRLEGTENIRGYYDFIIEEVVPDYLRYFRQQGLRISQDFVQAEFGDWATMNMKTKVTGVTLKSREETKINPLHKLQGIGSAVISLGNGQPAPEGLQLPPGCGFNHGYTGDISSLFKGNHDFYVVATRHPTVAPPAGQVMDEWLNTCIAEAEASSTAFYYWIFAVAKDAKLAPTPVPRAAPALSVPQGAKEETATINEHGKRPMDEEEEEEIEMEEEN